MKITISLEYEIEGERPSDGAIMDAMHSSVMRTITSEEVDGTDAWALVPKSSDIKIES